MPRHAKRQKPKSQLWHRRATQDYQIGRGSSLFPRNGTLTASPTAPCRLRGAAFEQSNQAALAEVAEIAASRALDQVDRELEEANFPRLVHPLDDGAERFVGIFDATFGAIDHRIDGIARSLLSHIGFAELKSVAQHSHIVQAFADLIDIALRFVAKSVEQQPAEMFGR